MSKMQSTLSEHGLTDRPRARDAARKTSGLDLRAAVEAQVIPRLHAALDRKLAISPLATPYTGTPCISGLGPQRSEFDRNDLRGHVDGDRALRIALDRAIDRDGLVADFTDCLLHDDRDGAETIIGDQRREGRSLENIYLHLLAPAAYRIKLMWSEDLCGFAEATLGLVTLQGVVRGHAPAFRAEGDTEDTGSDTGLRALLVSPFTAGCDIGLPMFGLMLMSEFFRRGGWDAWIERDLAGGKVRDTVMGEWFDLVEILATSDKQLDEIGSGIRAIRRQSANPRIGVMVCGQVFVDHPECVGLVGADFTAADPLSCLRQASAFLRSRAGFGLSSPDNARVPREGVTTRLTKRDRLS